MFSGLFFFTANLFFPKKLTCRQNDCLFFSRAVKMRGFVPITYEKQQNLKNTELINFVSFKLFKNWLKIF